MSRQRRPRPVLLGSELQHDNGIRQMIDAQMTTQRGENVGVQQEPFCVLIWACTARILCGIGKALKPG